MADDAESRGPRVAHSIDELIAGATDRESLQPEDARSGAAFERLALDGQRCFLKVLSYDGDWIMRVTGNLTHWEYKVWRAGIYQRVPPVIDHTILAMALDHTGRKPRLAMLMRDVGDALVPPGDATLPSEQHAAFIEHMAALHASFWGWRDTLELCSIENRLRFFSPDVIAPELLAPDVPGPVRVADEGWGRLRERAPALAELVAAIHAHPAPIVDAMRATPATFLPGDWKLGNLGYHLDGRSIVLDWAYPGEGPPCWDLAWYLALNQARLPQSKEDTIAAYRDALERHGVPTQPWWERQLALCLVGIMATFAWEKAVGADDELEWWVDQVRRCWKLLDALT